MQQRQHPLGFRYCRHSAVLLYCFYSLEQQLSHKMELVNKQVIDYLKGHTSKSCINPRVLAKFNQYDLRWLHRHDDLTANEKASINPCERDRFSGFLLLKRVALIMRLSLQGMGCLQLPYQSRYLPKRKCQGTTSRKTDSDGKLGVKLNNPKPLRVRVSTYS